MGAASPLPNECRNIIIIIIIIIIIYSKNIILFNFHVVLLV